MNRVSAALQPWTTADRDQLSLRADFLNHAATVPQPDHRDTLPDHVTASALVVSSDRSAVLLGLHRKVGLWLQFGGHVEPDDESLAGAALREAHEESGLTAVSLSGPGPVRLDRHRAPCSPQARYHLDVQFVATVTGRPVPHVSHESIDVRWFAIDQLPAHTDDAVRALVAASGR